MLYQNIKTIKLGDFNIQINDPKDQDAQILQDTLNAFNIEQHVNIPTHKLRTHH